MTNPNRFYVYAYLREDGTPYYIGKGTGNRIQSKYRSVPVPPAARCRKLVWDISEKEAFRLECQCIAYWGTKYDGTGILRNLTKGGEGASDPSQATRDAIAAGRTKENQQAVANIKKEAQAKKMDIPFDIYMSLSRGDRMTVQKRYARGIRGIELYSPERRMRSPGTGQSAQRMNAAAAKYGICPNVYALMPVSNRRALQARFRRGKRGAELIAGLVAA